MSKNGKVDYDNELHKLQVELNRIAQWVQDNGKRVLVLMEGRDTAGKGGAISAMRAHMNDRWCRT
ncbi:MAG: polyphosphate kinase 2, partial [Arenimonas sp.]|nr:polyphosphate kinase 2 [Arenimonas sp.]